MTAVAVVGGGITGLAAAMGLAEAGAEVVLLEASERLGGKLRTELVDGVIVEGGPDLFLARDESAIHLCKAVGLGDELVGPASFGALIGTRNGLRRLPAGFPYGLPASPRRAWRAGVLSLRGALRASADLVLPGPLEGPDVSLGDFVLTRFGREVLDNMVDPLLAGTRAGEPRDMSLAAAAPLVDQLGRSHRSLIRGLRAARRSGAIEEGPPPFLAIKGGMSRLVEALEKHLGERAQLRTGAPVSRITRGRRRYELKLDGATLGAWGVVLAIPAFAAADLLEEMSPEAAGELAAIEHASVATATLVYPARSWSPPAGTSGMLVAGSSSRALSACTWFSAKWPHLAPADGRLVMRCFVGRAGHHPALDLPDKALVELLAGDLSAALGLGAEPTLFRVTRWERGLPQYSVGHLERVARIEAELASWPRIAIAGASYRGSGLPDCIRQGRAAAARVLEGTGGS